MSARVRTQHEGLGCAGWYLGSNLSSASPGGVQAQTVDQRAYTRCHKDVSQQQVFRDGIMDMIRLRERRFHEHAYLFVLAALEYQQARLATRRHIDGRELALACRDLAIERYGVLARSVLEHWGIQRSADLGDVVFTLVDLGLLMSQASDTRLDFADAFDFDGAFEQEYPWSTANLT